MTLSMPGKLLAARHGRGALLAAAMCLAGFELGVFLWQEEIGSFERLRGEVSALRDQLKNAQTSLPEPPARADSGDQTWAPDTREAARVWPWLQQRLQAHGLVVRALSPGALDTAAGLPTQVAMLEVQGRWSDWLAFEQQLGRHAPWWSFTQWQVSPVGAGQVRMQWHLRWGWRPTAHTQPPLAITDLPSWPLAGQTATATVFDDPRSRSEVAADPPSQAQPQPELAHSPLIGHRLQGIWQQAGVSHAVLGHDQQQIVLTPGQAVGSEGYRVWRVDEEGVTLRAFDGRRPDIRFNWTGGAR